MPVYDTNDMPVIPGHFASKLVGATCEVTFTLKHFAIGRHRDKDGLWVEPNDVFSAQVETVAILQKPPVLAPSSYKGRQIRRPHHKPQLPSRSEQINAAQAFVPRLEFKLSATATSPSGADIVPVVPTPPSSALLNDVCVAPTVVTDVEAVDAKIDKAPAKPIVIEPVAANAVIGKIRTRGKNMFCFLQVIAQLMKLPL